MPPDLFHRTPAALYMDFYELSMAYGYWKHNMHNRQAVFQLYFRKNPFQGSYAVAAGQHTLSEYLQGYGFETAALDLLAAQRNRAQQPLFEDGFLRYLEELTLSCTLKAIPEGRLVFAQEPLLSISGPILECQLLEGALLNILGFQSLIATKAARICRAAQQDPVMEFGLRRAHGLQASAWASRAAYIGGVDSSSNVAAGWQYGIPLSGTHAHSWVMSFEHEKEAFERYAETMNEDCVLLVDTYDSLQGIAHAVAVGKQLAARGKQLRAIRIDSGDLAYLSQEARKALDAAGLQKVKIIASGDLNEHIIESLKQQQAAISAWGVGTHLSTAFAQPALGAVYKLSALKVDKGWKDTMKVSDTMHKASIPGLLQVRRFSHKDKLLVADMISEQRDSEQSQYTIISPEEPIKKRTLSTAHLLHEDMLKPLAYPPKQDPQAALQAARARCHTELQYLHPSICRLTNPHVYPVGLEEKLYQRRLQMMETLVAKNSP